MARSGKLPAPPNNLDSDGEQEPTEEERAAARAAACAGLGRHVGRPLRIGPTVRFAQSSPFLLTCNDLYPLESPALRAVAVPLRPTAIIANLAAG